MPSSHEQVHVICVTPVKNEAWILDRFLACASLWADHIILLDQMSDDGSRGIAGRYDKVTLLDNPSPTFNEPERQKMLIEAARQIPGRRLIMALDADEFLTADALESPEWKTVLASPEGTVFSCPWVNVLGGFEQSWYLPSFPFGVLDDGTEHEGPKIHSLRVPMREGAPTIVLNGIRILHYQFTDWERMRSKQRWYQCYETLHLPQRRPTEIFRRYHHMDAVPPDEMQPFRREWIAGYEERGIDMTSVRTEPFYRWDVEILRLFQEHGPARFRKLAIWDVDWAARYRLAFGKDAPAAITDPRGRIERRIHAWLKATQGRQHTRGVRRVERILRRMGW